MCHIYKVNTLKSALSRAVILFFFTFASHEVLIRDDTDYCFTRSQKEMCILVLYLSVTNGVNLFLCSFLKMCRGLSNTGALFNTEKQLLFEMNELVDVSVISQCFLNTFASNLLPHLGSSLQFFV